MVNQEQNIIEKFIAHEKWLFYTSVNGITATELDKILNTEGFLANEKEYLMTAHFLPFNEISEQIDVYDSNPSNETALVNSLHAKYNIDVNIIIRRIIEVREIKKYLKQNLDISFPTVKVYNQLVRDKMPDIIASNGDTAVYRTLNAEEHWSYFLKKDKEQLEKLQKAQSLEEIKDVLCDKLELIKTMANYYGFTFEEIIDVNNLKNEENGSFSKKLLLEKIISDK